MVFILSDLGRERTVQEVGLKTQGRNNRFLVFVRNDVNELLLIKVYKSFVDIQYGLSALELFKHKQTNKQTIISEFLTDIKKQSNFLKSITNSFWFISKLNL